MSLRSISFGIMGSLLSCTASFAWGAIPVGQVPTNIRLEGDTGGTVEGKAWDTGELKGKVSVIFYVAPSEKDLNKEASDAIKAKNFPREKYQSYAVINMAAAKMIPNFVLSKKIESSQKEFPHTTYVKDIHKAFVSKWNLADDNNDVVVLDKEGRVVFSHDGKLDQTKIAELISEIEGNL